MNKFTDMIKVALEKKHAAAHPDSKVDADASKTKVKKPGAPAIAGKPPKKVTGRGR